MASEYEYVDAVRHNTNLLIAFAGPTGSGKTYTALEVASGLAGDGGVVGVLDTEAGRATHYADMFKFKHLDLQAPFTPQRFLAAIKSAEERGFAVLVVDSASDEYEGPGGLADMHDAAMVRMARKESIEDLDAWQVDKLNAPAWSGPKTAHKRILMSALRHMRMHLIFCLRAEEKIEFVKVTEDGKEKTKIRPRGWVPICEKNFMYDMTMSFVMNHENPGVPLMNDRGLPLHGKLQEQHRHAFPSGKLITRESGRLLAEWAKGGTKKASVPPATSKSVTDRVDAVVNAITGKNTIAGVGTVMKNAEVLMAELEAAEDSASIDRIESARDRRLEELRS